MLQNQSGKQEIRWANLRTAVEYRNVITLAAKDQLAVVIPKRALNIDGLENLRQIVLNPKLTWRSRINLLDYLPTEIVLLWQSHPLLMAAAHLAGISCFLVLAKGVYGTAGAGPFAKWLFVALFLFLTITAEFWHLLISYLALGKFQHTWEVGFSPNGVHIKTAQSNSFTAWACFEKASEVIRCILLYTNTSDYYLLPKHCVPIELQSAVKQTLQTKLGYAADRLEHAQ